MIVDICHTENVDDGVGSKSWKSWLLVHYAYTTLPHLETQWIIDSQITAGESHC